jgi:hypothetical protein
MYCDLSHLFRLSHQNTVYTSHFSHARYMLCPPYLFLLPLDFQNMNLWKCVINSLKQSGRYARLSSSECDQIQLNGSRVMRFHGFVITLFIPFKPKLI